MNHLSKIPITLLAFVFLFSATYSQADEFCRHENKFYTCEKIYINDHDICIFDNSIYVHLKSGVIQTSALLSDVHGLYFKDFKRQEDCDDNQWKCNNCGNCNAAYYIWCKICGE